MVTPTPEKTLDALFPLPTPPTVVGYAPTHFPGFTSDSAKSLVKLLKENHERFHIFFNEKNFHNHLTHHLYAIYTLGSPPKVLEAAFESHAVYQREAIEPPNEITESNWIEHFDDERYFRAYVAFFTKVIMKSSVDAVLDKYVFATNANWVSSITDDKKQPQMVNRLLSGVLHPFIHVGYGIEFDSPGMVVGGLAMACVQRGTDFDALLPRSLFAADSLTSRLSSALTLSKPAGTHSFTIVAKMLKDPELAPGSVCTVPRKRGESEDEIAYRNAVRVFPMMEVLGKRGELIRKYAEQWTVNMNDKAEVKAKVDELSFLVTLLYGVAGLQEGKDFNADFFTMHLVTSSLFLHVFIEHLAPHAQSILLHSYLASALVVWVSRGRPVIPIASFFSRTSPNLTAPGPHPTPDKETLVEDVPTPNAWLALLQSTILHPNEHLPKAQRALAHFAQLYGDRSAGIFKGTELEDAELLDGTVFVRVAALTMDRHGWLREGQEKGGWDRSGFWE
ncbi:uncharacterized protein FOMMEDRAFT_111131 [Fomitiporia mediterranea MF3/22]|uniref:uncharacterized protein n=1 Tax=Fomitiporia mediterranea (strain MF3/22) TaxID=694068 RepID=UPI0004407B02|nr:uncharacterized protein FOMMEDRAFT_111131 [Fomitiporia mediterranea MF3/22]EJD01363.1 hypothetical protein FOMMEDRAFT_111131 [Fomitiporia mediterranea MF3/22]